MGVGFYVALVVFMICVTIVIMAYMDYCSANKVKMFANPKYEECINELERQMGELKKE